MSNAIGWFDIFVEDINRATCFYEAVFDKKLDKIEDPSGETQMMSFPADMSSYGAAGALVKSEYSKPGIGGTLIYFSVSDCELEQSRVAKAGGQIIRPKFSIGEFGWISLIRDTEGNIIGLNSMK